MAKKITLESSDLPYLNGCRVQYGLNRGYQTFDTEEQAKDVLFDFIEKRIHSVARELNELCKLQRKLLK